MKKYLTIGFLLLFFSANIQSQIQYSVDAFPTNVGGKSELKRIFDQELIYPQDALSKKIGGKLEVVFVINADSTITDAKVVQSIAPDIDKEAMRLFRLIQWVPAVREGKRVATNWSVWFTFEPEKYAKLSKKRGYETIKYNAEYSVDSSATIYKIVEQMPVYYKGNYALQDLIKDNLEYPKQAQLANIQGTVLLRFIVEPSGMITNIGIEKSVGGGCDQEAIRLIEMTKWRAGVLGNKWVRTYMTMPIYFMLNEDFKDNSGGEQK
jgi:TonB family protein